MHDCYNGSFFESASIKIQEFITLRVFGLRIYYEHVSDSMIHAKMLVLHSCM